jgi:hypothetical protein
VDGATRFLAKILPKIATEMALSALAYNLTRVINIIGVTLLTAARRHTRRRHAFRLLCKLKCLYASAQVFLYGQDPWRRGCRSKCDSSLNPATLLMLVDQRLTCCTLCLCSLGGEGA